MENKIKTLVVTFFVLLQILLLTGSNNLHNSALICHNHTFQSKVKNTIQSTENLANYDVFCKNKEKKHMLNILFICHGNICRSPMCEFIFRDKVQKLGLGEQFHIESAATSTEEIGNMPHHGTQQILSRLGISCYGKRARQIRKKDYDEYDYLIGMDDMNIRNMKRVFGEDKDKKIYKFLSFAGEERSIADPWYTGDFERTYRDVDEACDAFLSYLIQKGEVVTRS